MLIPKKTELLAGSVLVWRGVIDRRDQRAIAALQAKQSFRATGLGEIFG